MLSLKQTKNSKNAYLSVSVFWESLLLKSKAFIPFLILNTVSPDRLNNIQQTK